VIVVRVRGISMHNGTGLMFARMGPDKDTPPSIADHGPDILYPTVGAMFAKKEGNWFVFAVPPGRWRIAAMNVLPAVDFCLGAPSFEGRAGEVVYAGTFDLGSEDLGPDLGLDPVKGFLAGQPAAGKVLPAAYTNGMRAKCVQTFAYALEVKGAPFEPGYVWGGATHPAPAGAN
jgi:hypothetical protein